MKNYTYTNNVREKIFIDFLSNCIGKGWHSLQALYFLMSKFLDNFANLAFIYVTSYTINYS